MDGTINITKAAKMRELIGQLDQALEMAKNLNAQIDRIDSILEDYLPSRLAA
jgi:hypothetical protein